MRFKKIVMALFACMALAAFAANAAQAENVGWTIGTTENQTTGGALIASGTHERISCSKHGTSSLVLTSTLVGSPVELTVQGIDCLEKAGSTNAATIDNTTSKGHSEGVLTFTGVKVIKPENCEVPGGEITTNPLTDEVVMDTTASSTAFFDKFFPEVAANGFFTLEFKGASCALAEKSGTWKGTSCGESVHTSAGEYEFNPTGTLTHVQTLRLGAAQQTTGGCALTFGGNAAQLTGAVDFELSGSNAGKPFGAGQEAAPQGEWTIGTTENQATAGTAIPNGTHEAISCKKHGTSSIAFTTNFLGVPVEMTAEGVDCVKAAIDSTTSKGHSEGVLTFTGVKVIKPENCAVPGGELTTNQITDEMIMDPTVGSSVVFDRFFPEVAANGFFTLEFTGAECLLAGIGMTWTGAFCGESVHTNAGGTGYEPNKTGTLTRIQTLLFGSAQQTTGSTTPKPCAITSGKAVVQLTGAIDSELVSGKPFGAD